MPFPLNPLKVLRALVAYGRGTQTGRNLSAVTLATIVGNLMQFGWILLITRLLGADRFGVWGGISAWLVIAAALPEFGMGMIVLRDGAQRPEERGRYLGAMLILQPILSVVTVISLIALVSFLPYGADWRGLLIVASVTLIIDPLGNMVYSQFLAAERMIPPSLIRIAHQGVVIAFGTAVLLRGGGLFGLYLAVIAGSIFRVLMFWIALRLYGLKAEFIPRTDIRRIQGVLIRDGLPLMLGALLTLTYRYVNTILIGVIATPGQVALLTTANVIVFGIIDLVSNTVLVALSPIMARLYSADPVRFRRLINRFMLITIGISSVIGVGALLFAEPVLAFLLRPEYAGTAGVLQILVWFGLLVMLTDLLSLVMIIRGRGARTLSYRGVAVLVTVVLNLILLPSLLARGAAFALTGAQFVLFVIMYRDYRRP